MTSGERGVVYIEFLFAFVPLFLLFLGTCQLALLHTAKLVVHHAAFAAARSAVVVLSEDPQDYDGAPRGSLSFGRADAQLGIEVLLARLGLLPPWAALLLPTLPSADGGVLGFLAAVANGKWRAQQGARMAPIRAAAYMPLLTLAPESSQATLAGSVDAGVASNVSEALDYTKAASVLTVHDAPGSAELAREPIDGKASVTLRITYVYQCGVPIVRRLMCSSLKSLLGQEKGFSAFGVTLGQQPSKLAQRLSLAESSQLGRLVPIDASVVVFEVEATLPNQGAAYEDKDAA
jgi:Flp pilus assembly protein TadG